jgi:predicted kinase
MHIDSEYACVPRGINPIRYAKRLRKEMSKGVLIFFCGKMGAGKTTRSREIAQARNAVWVSEDEWLEALYPQKIASLEDYIEYSALLRPPMKKIVQSILKVGTDVVMDYPANTIQQRKWFRSIFSEIQAPHELIYIDLPNDVCLDRIAKRRAEQPERAATDTTEMFEKVTRYFVAPTSDEDFNTTVISENA